MSRIAKTIALIIFWIFVNNNFGFEEPIVEDNIISNQLDSLPNWSSKQTFLTIDTTFILKSPIEFDGEIFNYKREFNLSKGYKEWGGVYIDKLTEYGNVDSKNKPNGLWMFKLQDDWIPISGIVKNANKIGWWRYNCAYICKVKYSWNWSFTKTKISKKRILYD